MGETVVDLASGAADERGVSEIGAELALVSVFSHICTVRDLLTDLVRGENLCVRTVVIALLRLLFSRRSLFLRFVL